MKTTLSIAAIAMFAVILGMSALAPAMAAKADKIDVCHFSEEEIILVDLDGDGIPETEEVIPAEWKVINISGNAEKAHVGKHTDGENFDEKISDGFTVEDCLARNVVAEPEPPVTEPTA
ncbi:MAG: hypothetical protein K5790_07080 [Nitrosopumilus sp.]|uniref:hypothetical protein n=1 Tax=Nitrosopumilus sp. TaxID=2024843 RepID=UPI00247E7823|nr:hypothetical protein [Nitrosopumilus sp.]MCV0393036.1 hypothetical protein [Nitrosopumilus sp.]